MSYEPLTAWVQYNILNEILMFGVSVFVVNLMLHVFLTIIYCSIVRLKYKIKKKILILAIVQIFLMCNINCININKKKMNKLLTK